MAQYVLEILDGDRAGEIVELSQPGRGLPGEGSGDNEGDGEGKGEPKTRVTIGRRPGNTIVLRDEKASGNHAEVVVEDGRWVLRDLESTNGTLLDGRKVTEVALTPGDVFQVGLTRFTFRDRSAPAAADLLVHRVDQEMLSRSRRRSPALWIAVVAVAALGAAAWFLFLQRGEEGGVRRGAPRPVQRVAGNLLPQGADSFESEGGWDLQVSGASWQTTRGGYTGAMALEAVRADGDSTAGAGDHALARLSEPIVVLAGADALRLTAHVRASGGGLAVLRLYFSASGDGDGLTITSGTAPFAGDEWTPLSLELGVPPGMDRVQAELLALLPRDGATVAVDDVALLKHKGVAAVNHSSANGRYLFGTGANHALRSQDPVLLAVRPLVREGPLLGLAAAGLATLSDAGLDAAVEAVPGGFRIAVSGEPAVPLGGTGMGLVLELPAPSAAGVLTRGAAGSFEPVAAELGGQAIDALLCGSGSTRLLVRLPEPAPARGQASGASYRVELPGARSVDLLVEFEQEAQRARSLVREAEDLRKEGRFGGALAKVQELLRTVPHDGEQARRAQQLRTEVLEQLTAQLERARLELGQARFFRTPGAFAAVEQHLNQLLAAYGVDAMPKPEVVQAMLDEARREQQQLAQAEEAQHRQRLEAMAKLLDEGGQDGLRDMVQRYLQARQQASQAPTGEPQPGRAASGGEQGGR